MKNVTILGGLGYIGCCLTEILIEHDYNVTILDSCLFSQSHLINKFNQNKCKLIIGDVRHAEHLARAIKGANVVVNLSGLVGDPACDIDPEETWLTNIEASHLIADISNYFNVEKNLFSSSCSVYGSSLTDTYLNEGSHLNPVSLYARSKIQSEKIFSEKLNGVYSCLRLATVFGHSIRMRFDLVINLFMIKAMKENKIDVFGGNQYRPFIYTYDVAKAFYLLIKSDARYIDREIFNLCCDSIKIKDLGLLIKEELPELSVNLVEVKEDERNYKVSNEKIRELLGFKPEYDLKMGIKEIIKYINKYQFNDWSCNNIYYNTKRK